MYGSKDNGTGCLIFILIMVGLPVISFLTDVLDWIISNIGFIIFMICLIVTIIGLCYALSKKSIEDEEEEM